MKILNTPNIYLAPYCRKSNQPVFTGPDDKFVTENIRSIEKTPGGSLKSITFRTPLPPADTFNNLKNAMIKNENLNTLFLSKWHSFEEISEMGENLAKIKDIADIKLKRLMAMGVFALVFETDDGKVFKVVNNDHFRGRKPAEFDLPLIKTGKKSITHYYLEQMTSNENITQDELRKFVKYIESLGYEMRDYLYEQNDVDEFRLFKKEQFGKTPDGKLYLIDPGCAVEDVKAKLFKTKLKNKLSALKKLICFQKFIR